MPKINYPDPDNLNKNGPTNALGGIFPTNLEWEQDLIVLFRTITSTAPYLETRALLFAPLFTSFGCYDKDGNLKSIPFDGTLKSLCRMLSLPFSKHEYVIILLLSLFKKYSLIFQPSCVAFVRVVFGEEGDTIPATFEANYEHLGKEGIYLADGETKLEPKIIYRGSFINKLKNSPLWSQDFKSYAKYKLEQLGINDPIKTIIVGCSDYFDIEIPKELLADSEKWEEFFGMLLNLEDKQFHQVIAFLVYLTSKRWVGYAPHGAMIANKILKNFYNKKNDDVMLQEKWNRYADHYDYIRLITQSESCMDLLFEHIQHNLDIGANWN